MNRRRNAHGTAGDLARGALAGAAATWAMGRITTYLYEREAAPARRREDEVRGNATAYEVAAEKAANALHVALSESERRKVGQAIHWGLGAAAGATYGVIRHRVPGADLGAGLVFGTAFWLLVDEGANYAFGLTPGPGAFPWQAHARGLVGHLAFGAAADAALRAMEAAD